MSSSIALAAVAAALAIQSAASDTSAPLKPNGPWNLEYADEMCLLQRSYGTSGESVMLGFRPGMFSDHMRLVLARRGADIVTVVGKAQLSFDGGASISRSFMEHSISKPGYRVVTIDLEESDMAPLQRARQFRIKAGKRDYSFAPDRVEAAMKALRGCEKDLMTSWGMDPTTLASIARFPTISGGLVTIFGHNDYPSSAIARREQGTSGVRFWVGRDGRVRDCKVVESSGSGILDLRTCAIITTRGRFEPARNKTGQAVECIGFQRVRWELPSA